MQHKPYANQINLGVCCSIPEELNKYVKENNIQLLTHSDPIGKRFPREINPHSLCLI